MLETECVVGSGSVIILQLWIRQRKRKRGSVPAQKESAGNPPLGHSAFEVVIWYRLVCRLYEHSVACDHLSRSGENNKPDTEVFPKME